MKKALCASLLSACMTLTAGSTFAADAVNWPTRPVQVVVIANAGGDTDFNARMMAKYFTKITGEPMIVTNMAGGGGTIAAEQVKNSAPDGNTILFTHTGQLIVNEVAGLTEDRFDAFDVSCIAGVDKGAVFVSGKSSGIDTLSQLIARSKAEPNSVTYGTEMGSFSHLQGLMFEKLSGTKLKLVDSGTVSEKIVALLGKRIDLAAISYGSVQDYVSSGKMTALGQPNEERNPLLGDIKTFKEQGVDLVVDKPYVVAFPKGTDPAIVKKMADTMKQITEIPEYAQELKQTFKQPVSYYGTDDAIAVLSKTRDTFMQFKDELRQTK
ncbi:MAG: tripartite tricarboxylate transporter substrate binding protein [Pseudomonas sp.]